MFTETLNLWCIWVKRRVFSCCYHSPLFDHFCCYGWPSAWGHYIKCGLCRRRNDLIFRFIHFGCCFQKAHSSGEKNLCGQRTFTWEVLTRNQAILFLCVSVAPGKPKLSGYIMWSLQHQQTWLNWLNFECKFHAVMHINCLKAAKKEPDQQLNGVSAGLWGWV